MNEVCYYEKVLDQAGKNQMLVFVTLTKGDIQDSTLPLRHGNREGNRHSIRAAQLSDP